MFVHYNFRIPYIEAKRKIDRIEPRQEEGMGIPGSQTWEVLLSFGNLGEWDCSYNRGPLLGEIVEKFLSREVLNGPVVLALKGVVTGDTGLKSFKNHVLQTPGTLVSTPHRSLWICFF